jgi:hypothetical protein
MSIALLANDLQSNSQIEATAVIQVDENVKHQKSKSGNEQIKNLTHKAVI